MNIWQSQRTVVNNLLPCLNEIVGKHYMNVCAITALKGTSMCCKVHSPLWCKCYIVLMIPHLTFLEGSVDDKMF